MAKIEPRLLKGFRDFTPRKQTLRLLCIETLQQIFSQFGFLPIDTPILEYEDILLGKGGNETDKQVYRFEDNGKRKVVMRFDLTVPFARYVAMHKQEIPIPFARYQVGKVFRGENTQKGRYREFMQCDFDIIGIDHVSSDFTILQTIIASFTTLKLANIKVHISHRGLWNEFLKRKKSRLEREGEETHQKNHPQKNDDTTIDNHGHPENAFEKTLRIIDKIRKITKQEIRSLLAEVWDDKTTSQIIDFGTRLENNEATLAKLTKFIGDPSPSLSRLRTIYDMSVQLGIAEKIVLDPSITRGLDYYTGFVCETFVDNFEEVGSVCSGGRYNNLTKMFSNEELPGVGASVGLDRLLSIMESNSKIALDNDIKKVVIFSQTEQTLSYCHHIMCTMHEHALSVHIYPLTQKMKTFFKYSEQVQADFVCIIGSQEYESNTITIKNQHSRKQLSQVNLNKAISWIKNS